MRPTALVGGGRSPAALCISRSMRWQDVETICRGTLLVAMFVSGCGTAAVTFFVGIRHVARPPAVDAMFEIDVMSLVLNIAFPIAILASAVLALRAVRTKSTRVFTTSLVLVSFVGIFAPAVVLWSILVAMHGPSIHLWSRIWWSFA